MKNKPKVIIIGGGFGGLQAAKELANKPVQVTLIDKFATTLCGRDAVQILPPKPTNLDLKKLAENLKNIAEVKQNEYLVRLTVEGFELTIFRDARAIIRGTDNAGKARSIYAKYIGI